MGAALVPCMCSIDTELGSDLGICDNNESFDFLLIYPLTLPKGAVKDSFLCHLKKLLIFFHDIFVGIGIPLFTPLNPSPISSLIIFPNIQ